MKKPTLKISIFFLILFPLASNAMLNDYTVKQLSDFIKKKDQCQFAVGQTNIAITQMSNSIQKNESKWPMNPWILCVDDMVHGKGTIKEKNGCTLYYYNVESGETSMFRKELRAHLMVDKICTSGGFDELLKLKAPISTPYDKFANFDYNPTKGMVPVSTWLTDQGHSTFGVSGRVLLYSKKSGWEDWWKKERAAVVGSWEKINSENKAKTQKAEKEIESKQVKELKQRAVESLCYDLDVDRKLESFTMDDGYSLEIVDKPISKKKNKTFYVLRSNIPGMCEGCKSGVGGDMKCSDGFPKLDFL
jgi:hypothetical protein